MGAGGLFAHVMQLFGWLPAPLQMIAGAVVAIAVIWSLCKLIGIIVDILPFV